MRIYSKLLLAIILVSLLAVALPASVVVADDEVYFPDPVLREEIRDAIGGGDITQAKLAGLTSFHAAGMDIINLTGLEYCTNLNSLWLPVNQINNTAPLSTLTNLTELYLGYNQISDISALSSLTSLNRLDLRYNKIGDISALSSLTSLTKLYLDHNQISDISALSSPTSLTELYLDSNQISDISVLSSFASLTDLYLGNNTISDISALSSTTGLDRLHLMENQIGNVSPLVANTGLAWGNWVNLRHNPLSADSINIYIPQLENRGVSVWYDRGTGEGCFIATAAYGTSTAEEIDTLRAFRDEVLLQNSLGSQFVTLYYEFSPPVADFISEHDGLRTLTREIVVEPVTWLVKAMGTLWKN